MSLQHRTRTRIRALLALSAVALIGILARAPLPAHAAAGDPFPTGAGLVFVAQGEAGPVTTLYEATQGTGAITFAKQGSASATYNAIGYRTADSYLYGINSNNALVRVGQGGALTALGQVGLPNAATTYNQGAFGDDDLLYVRLAQSDRNLYAIDVSTKTTTKITLSAAVPNLSDFAWRDGYLWGIYGQGGQLYRIDPASGAVLSVAVKGLADDPYGAQWFYGNGNLGISNNNTGTVYQLLINNPASATPSITIVSTTKGPSSTQNDGAAYTGLPADLTITKAGPATWTPGQGFTYTLTVHNNGPGDSSGYVVKDTLPANLLGPATTAAGCTISAGVMECAGAALAAGADGPVITVTGTAPATTGTDCAADKIANLAAVTGNEADPNLADNSDFSTACPAGLPTPSFTVAKTASITAPAYATTGDTITYTLTVTNTGTVDYTAASPATLTDNLTDVLDDATFVIDSITGGGSFDGTTVTWSGPVAAGSSVTVTYKVTVNDPDTGDHVLTNAVVPGPTGECATATACTATTPVAGFTVAKTAAPAHTTAGGTVTYTITVTNIGTVNFGGTTEPSTGPAAVTDSLAGILPTAVYNNDANLGGTLTGTDLTWSLDLPIGATLTLTYTVTVNRTPPDATVLTNLVTPGDNGRCVDDDACTTSTPVAGYTISKTASATTAPPGSTVDYTITVTNTGALAYTADNPASFTDDLSGVLDDATYNGDATEGATLTGTDLIWSGPLAVGADISITYSVTVNDPDTGDHALHNVAVPGSEGRCNDACEPTAHVPAPAYTVAKTSAPASVEPGGTVTYTITVTNTGDTDYTTGEPAGFTDDLSGALDDATYNDDATEGATLTGTTLSWSGPLAVGAHVTITYSVTVNDPDTGDRTLHNTAVPGDDTGSCPDGCDTDTPIDFGPPAYTLSKTVSAATAEYGDVVTYTLTATNVGRVDYTAENPASLTDDLSGILDDATYNDDATEGATLTGTTLSWSGPLAVGAHVTITYSVTVNDPGTGDGQLINAARTTTVGGTCATVASCATRTTIATPSALPVTGTPLRPVLLAGAGIVLLGVLLVGLTRRRRSTS